MPHMVIAGKMPQAGLDLLKDANGVTHDHVTDEDVTEYLKYLPKADGLVLRTQPLTEKDIATAPNLKIVSRYGVGYDAVDVDALTARNIPLAIVGDVNSRTVAEHAMSLLLCCSREIADANTKLKAGDWQQRNLFSSREVDGKTLLIIGYGKIGRRLGEIAHVFGMKVLAHDPFIDANNLGPAEAAPDLIKALGRADAISLHMPASEKPVMGKNEIAAMKRGSIIVNTARGTLIDEPALLAALDGGAIAAAGLDVMAVEPPAKDDPLVNHPRTVVTPHVAGLNAECADRMSLVSIGNVLDCFAGKLDPALVVNGNGK